MKPDSVKVCFVGPPGVGKSTLLLALKDVSSEVTLMARPDNPSDPEERTAGIDVVDVTLARYGKFSFWDFAGQDNFHRTHGVFFDESTTIFILVLSLTSDIASLEATGRYWLAFLKACINPQRRALVILVGSRADKGKGRAALKRVHKQLSKLFSDFFMIADRIFTLDCRKASSADMDELRCFVGEMKDACLLVVFFQVVCNRSHDNVCSSCF